MKKQTEEPKKKPKPRPPGEGRPEGAETYFAPPPPSKGRIIGVDCHPDTFTAAPAQRGELEALSVELGIALTRVGSVRAGVPALELLDAAGRAMPPARGFDHFRA